MFGGASELDPKLVGRLMPKQRERVTHMMGNMKKAGYTNIEDIETVVHCGESRVLACR